MLAVEGWYAGESLRGTLSVLVSFGWCRSFLYYLFHSQLYTAVIVAAALAFLFLAFFEVGMLHQGPAAVTHQPPELLCLPYKADLIAASSFDAA